MEEGPHFKFEDFKVYHKALEFVDLVYVITLSFPKNELYNLTSQFKRAAVSIALNITERQGDSNAQFNRFLQIAMDSVKECLVCTTMATKQNFIPKEQDEDNRERLAELSKMIYGL